MHSFIIFDIVESFDVGTFHILPDIFLEYRASEFQQCFSKGLFFIQICLIKLKI